MVSKGANELISDRKFAATTLRVWKVGKRLVFSEARYPVELGTKRQRWVMSPGNPWNRPYPIPGHNQPSTGDAWRGGSPIHSRPTP